MFLYLAELNSKPAPWCAESSPQNVTVYFRRRPRKTPTALFRAICPARLRYAHELHGIRTVESGRLCCTVSKRSYRKSNVRTTGYRSHADRYHAGPWTGRLPYVRMSSTTAYNDSHRCCIEKGSRPWNHLFRRESTRNHTAAHNLSSSLWGVPRSRFEDRPRGRRGTRASLHVTSTVSCAEHGQTKLSSSKKLYCWTFRSHRLMSVLACGSHSLTFAVEHQYTVIDRP